LFLVLLYTVDIMASALLRFSRETLLNGGRSMSTAPEGFKVAVLGAAGGIGQPLSLLMKLNPLVKDLSLYDIAGTPGVACDISHCNTRSIAKGYAGDDALGEALTGCDLVIIPAGMPRKPGMTRDDLFKVNAGIIHGLISACGKHCPEAILNVISNPVNSTVPIAAETLKKMGVYDKKKLMGVTTLDVVRAKTFLASKAGADVMSVDVPVIGGHAGITILPLLSQATGASISDWSEEDIRALTARIQDGGTEVVQAKAGKGSATLSMAYAAALFGDACMRGLAGEAPVECTYVETDTVPSVPFFSTPCRLGKNGISEVLSYGELSEFEQQGLKAAIPELKASIDTGIEFMAQQQ